MTSGRSSSAPLGARRGASRRRRAMCPASRDLRSERTVESCICNRDQQGVARAAGQRDGPSPCVGRQILATVNDQRVERPAFSPPTVNDQRDFQIRKSMCLVSKSTLIDAPPKHNPNMAQTTLKQSRFEARVGSERLELRSSNCVRIWRLTGVELHNSRASESASN